MPELLGRYRARRAGQTDSISVLRQHPPCVLIASDSPWLALSLESVLGPSGFAVTRVSTGRQVLEKVNTTRADLLIIAADLPDTSGIELCRTLRTDLHVSPATPVVLLTDGPCIREQRLEALRAGAWECISFPLDSEELLLKLKRYVSAGLGTERACEEGALAEIPGLYSMEGLLRRLREVGLDARRNHRALACAVVALGESPASEAYGSPAGAMRRRMIDRLVRLLTSAARGSDTIGRLSEAEFAVLAPDADTSGVMKMARRIASAAMTKGTKRNQLSRLCIGCYAVADFSEASMEPVEILIRGLMALRCAQRDGAGDPIRFFDLSQPVIVLS